MYLLLHRRTLEETKVFKPLTVFQFAVVPGQAVIWIGVTPGAMLVSIWVAAVVLLQPYIGHWRVRIPTVKHTNTHSHILFVILHSVSELTLGHISWGFIHTLTLKIHKHGHTWTCMCTVAHILYSGMPGKSDSGFSIVQWILWICCTEPIEGNAEFWEECSWEYESMHSKYLAELRPAGATSSMEWSGCAPDL